MLACRVDGKARPDLPATLRASLANEWLTGRGNAVWVYGYQDWSAPIG